MLVKKQLRSERTVYLARYEEQEADDDNLRQVKEILNKFVKEEVRRLLQMKKYVQMVETR